MAGQQYYDGAVPNSKSQYGYPIPGNHKVSAGDIMTTHYFMNDEEWEANRKGGSFDYVIIGSSFCALAFITQALKNNPKTKILIIEGGDYLLPDHFQNLHPVFKNTVNVPSETWPWCVTEETSKGKYIKGLHGAYSFFGGRSSFWSAWCPEPTEANMEGWPKEVIKGVKKYFPKAMELLNIISADKIFSDGAHPQPMYGELQTKVQCILKKASDTIESITDVVPAPLAVKAEKQRYEYYRKYCVVGPLLRLLDKTASGSAGTGQLKVQAIINCLVQKIQHDGNGKATALETSKGDFILGQAKLVLAMGILPATTLVLNSFPKVSFPTLTHVGERFTAHFISSITARVHLSKLSCELDKLGNMELGAVYVAGTKKDSKQQFHIQITAVRDKEPENDKNIRDRIRHLPDVLASPSPEQLQTSTDHVILVCACLGELDHNNDNNWFRLKGSNDHDITCNASLQVVANTTDEALWDIMDDSTFQLLDNILSSQDGLEYWHSSGTSGSWESTRPSHKQRRHGGLVHEASTMWIGDDDDEEAPVGLDYRLRGIDNVYVTGASLWPKGGSWNPVGTIVSMAMHLADQLYMQASRSASSP